MKTNNYIVAYQNKDWKVIESNGVPLFIFVSALIFEEIKANNKKKYIVHSRIITAGESKEIIKNEKTFSHELLSECVSFVNSLLSNLEISNIDIFKFNSNDDYPHFTKWFKEKYSDALISLEKHKL